MKLILQIAYICSMASIGFAFAAGLEAYYKKIAVTETNLLKIAELLGRVFVALCFFYGFSCYIKANIF